MEENLIINSTRYHSAAERCWKQKGKYLKQVAIVTMLIGNPGGFLGVGGGGWGGDQFSCGSSWSFGNLLASSCVLPCVVVPPPPSPRISPHTHLNGSFSSDIFWVNSIKMYFCFHFMDLFTYI